MVDDTPGLQALPDLSVLLPSSTSPNSSSRPSAPASLSATSSVPLLPSIPTLLEDFKPRNTRLTPEPIKGTSNDYFRGVYSSQLFPLFLCLILWSGRRDILLPQALPFPTSFSVDISP